MHSHNCQGIICLFNDLFEYSEKTILIGNGTEPLYLPRDENFPLNRIIFTHDYFSSALHEVAHWCIAGKERRLKIDYGYWYNADGRNIQEQKIFEQAETKPQALEWIFSMAAGSPFNVSYDNLSGEQTMGNERFKEKIQAQVKHYLSVGLPERAELFKKKLLLFYGK